MGRQIDVYAGPLSEEDYRYMKMREKQFLLAENAKHFGEHPAEWDLPLDEEEGSETTEDVEVPEQQTHEGYDPDDVEYVRGIPADDLDSELSERGLEIDGSENDKRQRLLVHLDEQRDVSLDDEKP